MAENSHPSRGDNASSQPSMDLDRLQTLMNRPSSIARVKLAPQDTDVVRLSSSRHRRGAIPATGHFVSPDSGDQAIYPAATARDLRKRQDDAINTMDTSTSSGTVAGGNKHLSPAAKAMTKFGTLMYAAILKWPNAPLDTEEKRRKKRDFRRRSDRPDLIRKRIDRLETKSSEMGLNNEEQRKLEQLKRQSRLKDYIYELQGLEDENPEDRESQDRVLQKMKLDSERLRDHAIKSMYQSGYLSQVTEEQFSISTLQEMPNTQKQALTVVQQFDKQYSRMGPTDIQEIELGLENLSKGTWEGCQKLDLLICKYNFEIAGLEFNSAQAKSPAAIKQAQENTRAAFRGLEEKMSQLYAMHKEHAATNSENSAAGSIASSSYHTANSSFADDREDVRPLLGDDTIGHESANTKTLKAPGKQEEVEKEKGKAVSRGGGIGEGKGKAVDRFSEEQTSSESVSGIYANSENNHSTQRKALNIDSPAFTPAAANGTSRSNHPTLSSQAAAAAPFTPRAMSTSTTPNPQQRESDPISTLNISRIAEFTPSYDMTSTGSQSGANSTAADTSLQYSDPFAMSSVAQTMPSTPYHSYMEESNGLAADTISSYYQAQNNYAPPAQPLQYHLYAPQGPSRDDLLPYQRQPHEFFVPEDLRQHAQRRAEATLQVMPNSQLPVVDPYHSLVALDTNQHQSNQLFGYPSWIYKGLSHKNGHYYCLRRLEGYRATNDGAIRSVKDWRSVDGTHVVKIHDAFTTRVFGDSSLIITTDYHPLSKTLAEHHFGPRDTRSRAVVNVQENVLWSYIVQISLALKEIHQYNLAARCIDPSKVILTDKNRIRLNACAILDVVEFEYARPIFELQQEDYIKFGKLILSIATHTPITQVPNQATWDQLIRDYSSELVEVIRWLISPSNLASPKTVKVLFSLISFHTADCLSKLYSAQDTYTSEFFKELENSRLVRLVIKLSFINERPEYANHPDWAPTGPKHALTLMRDYIFHQVDAQGRARMDLGWVIGCLNKLDVGSVDLVELVSRDENTIIMVEWRELKALVAKTFAELEGRGVGVGVSATVGRGSSGGVGGSGSGSGSRRR